MTNKISLQGLLVISVLITGIGLPLDAFADVIPPNKQADLGFEKSEIFCKANLFKVIKKSNGMPACVNPEIVNKLVEVGWATPVNTELLDSFIKTINSRQSLGTVTVKAIVPQIIPPKITTSSPSANNFQVVFLACANDKNIRLPEVILRSDSAIKYVKLAEKIPANTCKTGIGKIQTGNKETITAELVNKGGVTKKITELENKVKELTEQLKTEKSQLSTRIKQVENPAEFNPDENRILKISELRIQLNSAKEELNRYQLALNLVPKIKSNDLKVSKTFTGVKLEGIELNLLSIKKQTTGNDYDVVFQMCAGNETIRIPIVELSSDKQDKSIKMPNKIISNTCQISGAKIKASSTDSIQVSISNTSELTLIVIDLEKKISELSALLVTQKDALEELPHQAPKPTDFREQEAKLAESIIDLRTQITLEKAKLFNILNQVYE